MQMKYCSLLSSTHFKVMPIDRQTDNREVANGMGWEMIQAVKMI